MTERILEYHFLEKDFSPCMHCSNVFSEECLNECAPEMKFSKFTLRPGTGIKDLPAFPMNDIIDFPDPAFRLVTLSIYIAAITDYLQHEEEYKFREEAPKMKSLLPKGFEFIRRKYFERKSQAGQSDDDPGSSPVPEIVKE